MEQKIFVEVMNRIRKGEIEMDYCDIAPKYIDWKSVDDNIHASSSEVVFMTLPFKIQEKFGTIAVDLKTAVKMFLNPHSAQTKNTIYCNRGGGSGASTTSSCLRSVEYETLYGLEYEVEMYALIRNILFRKESPNFIAYIGSGVCSLNKIQRVFLPQWKEQWEGFLNLFNSYLVEKDNFSDLKVNILLTRVPPNSTSFYEWAHMNILNVPVTAEALNEYRCIMFQIVYTLAVLQKHHITHNDLHARNIIISQLPTPVTLTYTIEKEYKVKKYRIVTRNIVYIFDWDNAYAEELGDNPSLSESFCNLYKICNRFDPYSDLYTILCFCNFFLFSDVLNRNPFLKARFESRETVIVNNKEQSAISLRIDDRMQNPWLRFLERKIRRRDNLPENVPFPLKGVIQLQKREFIYFMDPTELLKNIDNLNIYYDLTQTTSRVFMFDIFPCKLTFESKTLPTPADIFFEYKVFDSLIVPQNTLTTFSLKFSEQWSIDYELQITDGGEGAPSPPVPLITKSESEQNIFRNREIVGLLTLFAPSTVVKSAVTSVGTIANNEDDDEE